MFSLLPAKTAVTQLVFRLTAFFTDNKENVWYLTTRRKKKISKSELLSFS